MSIYGYTPFRPVNSNPPTGDAYYDSILGLPFFSADEIPDDWSSIVKVSSHDWVSGQYPPMQRFSVDGTELLAIGNQAVLDMSNFLLSDKETKPTPVMLTPVLNKDWNPALESMVSSNYSRYFDEPLAVTYLGDSGAKICYLLTFAGSTSIDYVDMTKTIEIDRVGGVPEDIALACLKMFYKTDNRAYLPYIMLTHQYTSGDAIEKEYWGQRISVAWSFAHFDHNALANAYKSREAALLLRLYSLSLDSPSLSIGQKSRGIQYAASFIFGDGTESNLSNQVLGVGLPMSVFVGVPLCVGRFLNPDPTPLDQIGWGEYMNNTNFELSIQYVPFGATKVRYWMYFWDSSYTGIMGWNIIAEIDAHYSA